MSVAQNPTDAASLVGVAVVAGSAAGLAVVLERLAVALLGAHFAPMPYALALVGVALGSAWVTVSRRATGAPSLHGRLATSSGLAALASGGAIFALMRVKAPDRVDSAAFAELAVFALLGALPFAFSAATVVGLSVRAPRGPARTWSAAFAGIPLGLLAVSALWPVGAPRVGLLLGVAQGFASILFAVGGAFAARRLGAAPRSGGWVAAACFLSSISVLLGDIGAPYLRLPNLRAVQPERALFLAWGEHGLVTVDKPSRGQTTLRTDATRAMLLLEGKTDRPKGLDELAFVGARSEGRALVVSAGAGREVRTALDHAFVEVHAIEPDTVVARDVMLGELFEFSGGLYARPEVKLFVGEARTQLRRRPDRYAVIVLALVDAWAEANLGRLATRPEPGLTVEAFVDYLAALDDDGALFVQRPDQELERLLATLGEALRASGAGDPAAHLFGCSYQRATGLLVTRRPLDTERLRSLRKHCKKSRYPEVIAPDKPLVARRAELLRRPGAGRALSIERDASPVTDDRPFYAHSVPASRLGEVLRDRDRAAAEQQGLAVLFALFGGALLTALLVGLLSALARPRLLLLASDRGPRLRAILGFGALGLGAGFAVSSLVESFGAAMGQPARGSAVAALVLFVGASLGARALASVRLHRAAWGATRAGLALALLLAALALTTPSLRGLLGGLPLGAKLAVAVVLLGGAGALLGGLVALGSFAAIARSRSLGAFCFAASASVASLAYVLGTGLRLALGYSFTLLVAAVAVYVAAGLVPAPRVRAVLGSPR